MRRNAYCLRYDLTVLKALFITIVFFCIRPQLLLSSTNPEAQQVLLAAQQQANLFLDQNSALQLDVDFVTQNVPGQGHLRLKWKAENQWRREIDMGDFEQVEVRNADRLYISRNMAFTPVRVQELIRLLRFAEGPESLMVKKQKERSENGIDMLCLRVDGESRGKDHEICIGATSHEILSDQWQEPPDQKRTEQYADYFNFGRHRYPRKLQLLVNDVTVLTATVNTLSNAVFDESLLLPPVGAVERRKCPDLKHPIPVKTPTPLYPRSASQNKIMGDTTVSMTVLTDGSVTDIQLAGGTDRSMDDATLQTLKGWKFKPAMCGAEPVVSDIEVVVSFRLR